MITFTVHRLENPPTMYGLLKGPFGLRVFYNKPAGLKALLGIAIFLSDRERENLKKQILSSQLPSHDESSDMEELVVESLPNGYVM